MCMVINFNAKNYFWQATTESGNMGVIQMLKSVFKLKKKLSEYRTKYLSLEVLKKWLTTFTHPQPSQKNMFICQKKKKSKNFADNFTLTSTKSKSYYKYTNT